MQTVESNKLCGKLFCGDKRFSLRIEKFDAFC